MSTPQAQRRPASRATKSSRASSPHSRRASRSQASSSAASSPQSQSQSQSPLLQTQPHHASRSPRASSPHAHARHGSHAGRSPRGSTPHTHAHAHSHAHHGSHSRASSHGRHGSHAASPARVPSHVASSVQARSQGSTARSSRERSPFSPQGARERQALCRYMERYGALQPLRMALLQLYESRPTRPQAMVQLRASLGDHRPTMQEWQVMKRQCSESVNQIASLTAEGERLRKRLDYLTRGVLPSLNFGRSVYR